jgi:NAD(P)H-hydrate epimerase
MSHGVAHPDDLTPLLKRATVIAIGPGLGVQDWGIGLLRRALDAVPPLVVDADALNLLAGEPAHRADWMLTPHPGEAARLLGTDTTAIGADRFGAARRITERYGGVCVLKGSGSIVAAGGRLPGVCTYGNPGMASGGMGDVLTGVLAGLLAQGIEAVTAARIGTCLHALAADRAAAGGERGMLASDLLPFLRELVN